MSVGVRLGKLPVPPAARSWWARFRHPAVLRWCSTAVAFSIVALVGSGGWVRLSDSGLGCPTWPKCTSGSLVAPDRYHALVEFVNRGVITAVGVLVAVTVVAALARQPRKRGLVWLAAGLVVGYLGEAVLGGLTVLFKLAPPLVAGHLLLAMLILADAVVLQHRAGGHRTHRHQPVHATVVWLMQLVIAVMATGVVIGTVLTGAGPHSGAPDTRRLALPFGQVAHIHAAVGIFAFGLLVAMWFVLRDVKASALLWRRYWTVVAVMAAQGAIGYATYFSHVQVDVTELHIVGGAVLLAVLLRLRLVLERVAPVPAARPAPPVDIVEQTAGQARRHVRTRPSYR